MASVKLPPLDFRGEVKDYEAYEEKKSIDFPKCSHKNIKIKEGWLRCQCGVGYTGTMSQMIELQKAFNSQD